MPLVSVRWVPSASGRYRTRGVQRMEGYPARVGTPGESATERRMRIYFDRWSEFPINRNNHGGRSSILLQIPSTSAIYQSLPYTYEPSGRSGSPLARQLKRGGTSIERGLIDICARVSSETSLSPLVLVLEVIIGESEKSVDSPRVSVVAGMARG